MPEKTPTDRLVAQFLAEYTHDPLGFVYAAFPWGEGDLKDKRGPEKWQADTLRSVGKRLSEGATVREAIASGHGIGKSALVAWLILWAISTHEDTRGIITANTETQLRSKTWAELAKWYRRFLGKHLFTLTANALTSTVPGHERSWRIDATPWSDASPESFAGLHNQGSRILVIFDEASAISDTIWEVTEGAMTDKDTELIWCVFGNPTRKSGRFYDCFHRFRKRWHHRQIDSRTVTISDARQIAEWIADYGENSDFIRVRVRGLFPTSSEKQLIPTELAEAAAARTVPTTAYEFAPAVIGVDPAWSGTDAMAIVLRRGIWSTVLAVLPKQTDDMETAGLIARFQDEHRAQAVFIDLGYGTGIYSAGKTLGRTDWRLISFAARPTRQGYANKRAEMWHDMKDWLEQGGKIDDDRDLIADLTAPEAFINAKGLLQLESKEAMKKRGLPSPNIADALALTFAYPLRAKKHTPHRTAPKYGGM